MLIKLRNLKSKKGFTLIELMIVVAIIGILAAVAIPQFLRFIRKSKTTEAPLNVKQIANGAVAWYDGTHSDAAGDPIAKSFPSKNGPQRAVTSTETTTTPSVAPCTNGLVLYKKNPAQWNVSPWTELKYGIPKSHYYQYTYTTNGVGSAAVFTVIAKADLDCDKTLSSYQIRATIDKTSGEVQRSNIIISNALE